eukprot:4856382-Lingulodinium_polyedra.AAC.1
MILISALYMIVIGSALKHRVCKTYNIAAAAAATPVFAALPRVSRACARQILCRVRNVNQ